MFFILFLLIYIYLHLSVHMQFFTLSNRCLILESYYTEIPATKALLECPGIEPPYYCLVVIALTACPSMQLVTT